MIEIYLWGGYTISILLSFFVGYFVASLKLYSHISECLENGVLKLK